MSSGTRSDRRSGESRCPRSSILKRTSSTVAGGGNSWRKSSNTAAFAGKPVELVYGDVTDRASVEAAIAGCTHVYHLANVYDWWLSSESPHYEVNVEGTRNVMESALAAGVERAVYTGSYLTLIDDNPDAAGTDQDFRSHCIQEYTRTKRLGEQEALKLAAQGLPIVSVLPTAVYGPDDTKATGKMLLAYLRGRLPAMIEIRANMVYVDDVVDGHIAAMERGKIGERYVLGGDNISSAQVLALMAELSGRRWIPPRLPRWMCLVVGAACEAMAGLRGKQALISRDFVRYFSQTLYVDSDKARGELRFSHTSPQEGLRKYVEWVKTAGLM